MKSRFLLLLMIWLTVSSFPPGTWAQVEWQIQKTLKLDTPPVDMAVSASGKWIFVLTEGGDILAYSADGTLKDTIKTGIGADRIRIGQNENLLYLQSTDNKTVQIVNLDFIQDFHIGESPVKGPTNARVALVVFTDFQ